MVSLYPWQQSNWQNLLQQQQRFPHALLLEGASGMGKAHFAQQLLQFLLCQQPKAQTACQQCRSCLLHSGGAHPDSFYLQPEENSRHIKVDAVRALLEFTHQSAHFAGNKVVLINPADNMNIAAQNALLKTLEAPANNVYLLLVSAHPSLLLPTILSRVQRLALTQPSREQARQWWQQQHPETNSQLETLLDYCQNSPLALEQLWQSGLWQEREKLYQELIAIRCQQQDPLRISERWSRLSLPWVYQCLQLWLHDCIKLSLLPEAVAVTNSDFANGLKQSIQNISLSKLFNLMDEVLQISNYLNKRLNVNQQLALDCLLCRWQTL